MACGLPCGPKMHAAFHAGGKCMRPSVRADNARGAEWCLLNPTGRPYEAFVAAEVAVFVFFVVAFCTVVGLFVVIAVVAVVVVIDVVVAVDVAVIVVTVVTVVLVVTVVVRGVVVAAAVVAVAVAVAVVVVIVVVVVVVVVVVAVVAHLLGVVGIDADVVVGGGIDAGVGVRVRFVLVVGDGALFPFGVVKLQQLLQQRESPTNTRVESKSIIWHLVHLQAAGKAACIDRPRGSNALAGLARARAFTASLVGRMHRPPAWKAAWSVLQHGWHMLALLLVRRTIEQKGNLDVDVLVNPAVPCVLLLSRLVVVVVVATSLLQGHGYDPPWAEPDCARLSPLQRPACAHHLRVEPRVHWARMVEAWLRRLVAVGGRTSGRTDDIRPVARRKLPICGCNQTAAGHEMQRRFCGGGPVTRHQGSGSWNLFVRVTRRRGSENSL